MLDSVGQAEFTALATSIEGADRVDLEAAMVAATAYQEFCYMLGNRPKAFDAAYARAMDKLQGRVLAAGRALRIRKDRAVRLAPACAVAVGCPQADDDDDACPDWLM